MNKKSRKLSMRKSGKPDTAAYHGRQSDRFNQYHRAYPSPPGLRKRTSTAHA